MAIYTPYGLNKESEEINMKEKKTAKDLAKEYYPTYWDISRLVNLVSAGKLTEDDYNEIRGFVDPATE